MSDLLRLENIDSYYGQAHILHDLSLRVGAGERVALLGRNGVGKTTVVNSLLGIASVRRGEIAFNGSPVKKARYSSAARAGISVVPQGRGILSNLTVRENLILGTATRRPGHWTIERVFDLFPILRERQNGSGEALSGGQQQMLAIGRALMACPDLLILDEPTEGLAPVIIDELAVVLNGVAAGGTAILLIEQDIGLVARVSERYYVLSKGSVVRSGNISDHTRDEIKNFVML